jgi:uronate dehydrogenase
MEKVLITGNKGTIGYLLMDGLAADYELIGADLPEVNLEDYSAVEEKVKQVSRVIHLAWNTKVENYDTGQFYPGNLSMAKNIFEASLKHGIKQVIMASSVHADNFYAHHDSTLLEPYRLPAPISYYGVSKVAIETMGRMYAQKGLEVIGIRLGGVSWNNEPDYSDQFDPKLWLSRNDCLALFKTCLQKPPQKHNYVLMYAVSDNQGKLHDTTNPFGWSPQEGIKAKN